jgi:hypothetical protein
VPICFDDTPAPPQTTTADETGHAPLLPRTLHNSHSTLLSCSRLKRSVVQNEKATCRFFVGTAQANTANNGMRVTNDSWKQVMFDALATHAYAETVQQ